MADLPEPTPRPQPDRPHAAGSHERRRRESADDRRSRRVTEVITVLRDLKREAAERRARKSDS